MSQARDSWNYRTKPTEEYQLSTKSIYDVQRTLAPNKAQQFKRNILLALAADVDFGTPTTNVMNAFGFETADIENAKADAAKMTKADVRALMKDIGEELTKVTKESVTQRIKPIAAAFSIVLLPAMMRLFLSIRIDRPAPNFLKDFSIRLLPYSVPLLKFLLSGIKSFILVVLPITYPYFLNFATILHTVPAIVITPPMISDVNPSLINPCATKIPPTNVSTCLITPNVFSIVFDFCDSKLAIFFRAFLCIYVSDYIFIIML
jgi:hypothetical protein